MSRALAVAILAILLFGAGWQVRAWKDQAALTADAEAEAIALAQAAINLAAMQAQTNMEAAAYEQERKASEDRADAADAALDRLRKALLAHNGAGANSGPASGSDDGARERTALGNCAAEYRRMAGIAERYRSQLMTLQAWAKLVSSQTGLPRKP